MRYPYLLIAVLLAAAVPLDANAEDIVLQGSIHGAMVTDEPDRRALSPGFGYTFRGGLRWDNLGVFLEAGQSAWVATSTRFDVEPGVLNIGVGGEFLFIDRRLKMSAAIGTSTLLFDAVFDQAGSSGLFVAIRPISIRWPLFDDTQAIELTPISAVFMKPGFSTPSPEKFEYQTVLTWEFSI